MTVIYIFKAKWARDKWTWSATHSTQAGTADRQEEHRAKKAASARPISRQYKAEYLARWSAELGTIITSTWQLHQIKNPGYPKRG